MVKSSSQGGLEELNFSNSDFLTDLDEREDNPDLEDAKKVNAGGSKTNRDRLEQLQKEREEKKQLEEKLTALQAKFANVNSVSEEEQERVAKYRQMQLELETQKQREKELEREKEEREEEVMMAEKNYLSLQEEVVDMRRLIKNFRVRYKQAVNEIKDLNYEHAKERQELFESITGFEKEASLYKEILMKILDSREIIRIEQKCTYDPDNKRWTIPDFQVPS